MPFRSRDVRRRSWQARPRLRLALLGVAVAGISVAALVRTSPAGSESPAAPAAGEPAAKTPVPREAPAWVWLEAERPKASNFPNKNPFAPRDPAGARTLSEGGWLGAERPTTRLFLSYDVTLAKNGTFTFYARKFGRGSPFTWRFDDDPWRTSSAEVASLDDAAVYPSVNASWIELGKVELDAGKHALRVEVEAGVEAIAFDCFVLAEGSFTPRGTLKPGSRHQGAPEGWFAFDPDVDQAIEPAPLNLRFLNEKTSGEHGFIQVRGASFVHEKTGQPVRFWGVDAGAQLLRHEPAAFNRFARRLARLGVNMVRLHAPLWREDDFTKLDQAKLVKLHALVASLKTEGIYLALSTYFPLWLSPSDKIDFPPMKGQEHPFAVPFFDQRFQDLQKSWWRAALTQPNPATGLSLVQDPTLAFIEIINEDGLLFWTFHPYLGIPEAEMSIIEKQFGDWLSGRYGGLDKALAAWGTGGFFARWFGGMVKGDDPPTGRIGFLTLDQIVERRETKRAQDTAEFLAHTQRTYFDRMYTFLKKDLGFRGSVSCSNWGTADARVLGPLDKVSNARCDFIDRHAYHAGPHEGARNASALSNGDRFNDAAALRFETGRGEKADDPKGVSFDLPIMDLAWNGKPSTNSAINWLPPNRFRAEMPLVTAAYGALQGSDGFAFYTTGEVDWARRLDKFTIADPVAMGQFPAAALIFRRGLVRTAEPALRLELALAEVNALNGIPEMAPQHPEAVRTQQVGSIDPLAFLVGPVEVNVTKTGGRSRVTDLGKFIDRGKRVVRSATGELRWDYGRGVVTVDAPQAQGIAGFLSQAGTVGLGDVQISSPLEYGSIVVVALDERPIKTSRRLLVQVMSEDRNSGWSAPGSGMRTIEDVGGPPLVVKNMAGKVVVRRPDAAKLPVVALDFNGRAESDDAKRAASPAAMRAHDVTLQPRTMYYLIEAPPDEDAGGSSTPAASEKSLPPPASSPAGASQK